MTTRINQVLNSLDALVEDDFCESAELYERRFDLMASTTNIHIEDFDRVEDLIKFKDFNFNVYSADGKYAVKWDPWGVSITDITDAMQSGKSVKYVELDQSGYEKLDSILSYLRRMGEEHGTIEAFMASLTDDARIDGFDMAVRIQKGKNVFNPVIASKLKRVVKLPKRWSVDTLARIIANGQFKSLASGNRKRVTDLLAEIQGLVQGDGSIIEADNKDNTRAIVEYYNQRNSRRICEVNLGLV